MIDWKMGIQVDFELSITAEPNVIDFGELTLLYFKASGTSSVLIIKH
jgi:hypothetical protein